MTSGPTLYSTPGDPLPVSTMMTSGHTPYSMPGSFSPSLYHNDLRPTAVLSFAGDNCEPTNGVAALAVAAVVIQD